MDSYPLPKPEDLLARLARGKTFSILDLSQAYLELELDKDSRKFVTINSEKGLFHAVHQVTIWCLFRSRYILIRTQVEKEQVFADSTLCDLPGSQD